MKALREILISSGSVQSRGQARYADTRGGLALEALTAHRRRWLTMRWAKPLETGAQLGRPKINATANVDDQHRKRRSK